MGIKALARFVASDLGLISGTGLFFFLLPFTIWSQNLGINQPAPIWPLDILSPQCVARLTTTSSPYGSVLELKNTNPSAQYLGAINFNDPGATYPGQIAYLANHRMAFRVGQYERMSIDNYGKIVVTSTSTSYDFEIQKDNGKLEMSPTSLNFRTYDPEDIAAGVINFRNWGDHGGQILYTQDHRMYLSLDGSIPLRLFPGGKVGVSRVPATNILEVEGNASKSTAGDWLANSDARLKKNLIPLNSEEMLDKLLALKGITYEWNDDKTNSFRPTGIQYGFTAQNIQEVFPTLVEPDSLGYLQTGYGTYDPMMVEAIRALNDKIETLEYENEQLKAKLEDIDQILSSVLKYIK